MTPVRHDNRKSQTSASPQVYFLGPFRFESEFDLPELRNSAGSGEIPIDIRLGEVPDAIPGALFDGVDCFVSPTEYLLDIPAVARFYVCNGREVRLDIVPGAPVENVTTYLLGSVFGALCHQNGMLPLHASAVEASGAVTAFLGDSAAGKSTLAACLARRGYPVVADDICLLQDHGAGVRVIPVAGWLKLWNQSLQHLGQHAIEENRVFRSDDKFRLYLQQQPIDPGQTRPPLHNVVFLERNADPHAAPSLQPVSPLEAIAGLMKLTYAGYVPELAGQKSRIFEQSARAMRQARAWQLSVPWGLDQIESVLHLLEDTIL